jgi:hypothetical protein
MTLKQEIDATLIAFVFALAGCGLFGHQLRWINEPARSAVEGLFRLANRFLYTFFNTSWALIYYFAFWQKPTLVALIVFAFLVDLVRLDRGLCRQIWSRIFSFRGPIVGGLALFAMVYFILVLNFDAKELTFGGAYLHYEQAMRDTTTLGAQAVFVFEIVGVSIGFGVLIFNSIRHAAGQEIFQRRSAPKPMRFSESYFFFFLLMFQALTFSAWMWDALPREHYDARITGGKILVVFFSIAASMFLLAIEKPKLDSVGSYPEGMGHDVNKSIKQTTN